MADLDAEVDDPYAFGQWDVEKPEEIKDGEGEVRPQSNGRGTGADGANGVGDLNATNRLAVRNPDAPVSENTRQSSSGAQNGGFHDADHEEALAAMVGSVALRSDDERHEGDDSATRQHPSSSSSLHLVSTLVEPVDAASGTSSSPPVPIIASRVAKPQKESVPSTGDLDPPLNAANSHARLDNSAEVLGPEGPMTPRNDAGPFVFDGSAGRALGGRVAASLDDTAADTEPGKD
jgi:hypothetical protein